MLTTTIVTYLIGLASKLGVKAATALIPYAVAITPAAVFLAGCGVLYARFSSDRLDLALMVLVLVNGAVMADQLRSSGSPASPPANPPSK